MRARFFSGRIKNEKAAGADSSGLSSNSTPAESRAGWNGIGAVSLEQKLGNLTKDIVTVGVDIKYKHHVKAIAGPTRWNRIFIV